MRVLVTLLALLAVPAVSAVVNFEPDIAGRDLIVIGDSWSENTSGSEECTVTGFDMWSVILADRENVNLRSYAVCGAPSADMLTQAQTAVSDGIAPGDLVTYWLLPNDYEEATPPSGWDAINDGIETNATAALAALIAGGADNILVMTLPDGELIPLIEAGAQVYETGCGPTDSDPCNGTHFTDGINAALINAANANGLTIVDTNPFFTALDAGGDLTWAADDKHFTEQSNIFIAQYVYSLDRL